MRKTWGVVLIIMTILFSCSLDLPEDPKAPKWDIAIEEIPLLKADTLRIGDKLKPGDFNRLGPDSILSLNISDQKSFGLKSKLKINEQYSDFSAELGEFEIVTDQPAESKIYFTDLYPELADKVGGQAVLEPRDLNPIENDVQLTDFDSVSVVTGMVRYKITNNLGFDINGDVRMAILDVGRGMEPDTLDIIELKEIQNLETKFYYTDISGRRISSQIQTVLFGELGGSDGQEVTIPQDSRIDIIVVPVTVIVNEAYGAKLKEQSLDLVGHVDINSDSLSIKQAEIEYGSITLNIRNNFSFDFELKIEIPNLKDQNNVELSTFMTLGVGEQQTVEINMDNSTLELDGQDLTFNVNLKILPTQGLKYNLKNTDMINASVHIFDIQFLSVTADFNLTTWFPDIQEDVFKNRSEDFNNFDFKDVWLRINFLDTPFDLGLNLTFTALRSDTTYSLKVQKNIARGETLLLNYHGVNDDNSTPTIVDLVNLIPEEMLISGKVRVMGENITFHKDDEMGVHYDIDFPLTFSTHNSLYSKVDTLKISEDTRKKVKDYSISGGISLSLENAIPISGYLALLVGPKSDQIDNEVFRVNLPRPVLNQDGIVVQPVSRIIDVELDRLKFLSIADGYYYQFILALDDYDRATLTANDYIIVHHVYISGKFLFDPENM